MNREEAKKILPIITAYAEGKVIQVFTNTGIWVDSDDISLYNLSSWPEGYRIKPDPKYRPFKDGAECWEIVQKEGFDWVKIKGDPMNTSVGIAEVNESNVVLSGSLSEEPLGYKQAFNVLTFLDGTPFGMKEGGKQ